jgi:hypothetical protein
MKNKRELLTITDEILDEFPDLVDVAQDYLNKRIRLGSPCRHLNGSRCWTYAGHVRVDGYGMATMSCKEIAKDITFKCRAHRLAYMVWVDRIKKGVVQHKCDNTNCVNPDHLQDETQSQNIIDAYKRRDCASQFNKTWKLTAAAVSMIKKLSRAGIISIQEIAKAFSVCDQTVMKIRDGKTYWYID